MYGPGLDVFERSSSYQLSINFVKCRFYCDCLNAISSGTWRYNHNATASVRSRLDNCKQKHHKSLAAARAASNYVMEILENVLVWCKMLPRKSEYPLHSPLGTAYIFISELIRFRPVKIMQTIYISYQLKRLLPPQSLTQNTPLLTQPLGLLGKTTSSYKVEG